MHGEQMPCARKQSTGELPQDAGAAAMTARDKGRFGHEPCAPQAAARVIRFWGAVAVAERAGDCWMWPAMSNIGCHESEGHESGRDL